MREITLEDVLEVLKNNDGGATYYIANLVKKSTRIG